MRGWRRRNSKLRTKHRRNRNSQGVKRMPSVIDRFRNITRRSLFQRAGAAAAAAMLPAERAVAAPATSGLQLGSSLYESIGVTPLVNCRGTFTIITGSLTLPEVKRAMDEAS